MLKYDRKSLIATGLAGLVFAAGSSASRPQADAQMQPGWLAKELRQAAVAKRARTPVAIPSARKPNNEGVLTQGSGAKRAGAPTGRYFIELEQPALVRHLSAERAARGEGPQTPLDMRGPAAKSYEAQLRQRQTQAVAAISAALGRVVTPKVQLTKALNGFSIEASPSDAERLAQMSGVRRVSPVLDQPLDTDVGPGLIGAPAIWDGSATGSMTMGEGITVGIIDSGINSNHPSFAETAGAFTHTNPNGTGTFLGYCETNAGFCNDKLIGAYDFVFDLVNGEPDIAEEASPEDNNSHGTHTASTTAGNPITVDFGGATNLPISGVAPHANIIAYDACYTKISTSQGLCPQDATAAAVEQAIDDAVVKVINFSIGGGDDPYNDFVSDAFLSAVESGIYIATSAGNDGPDAETVGHNEPWTTTTAATTHNRAFSAGLSVTGPTTPATLQDIPYVQGTGVQVTVDINDDIATSAAVQADNVDACDPFAAGAFAGKIALVQRGNCDFVVKVQNAQDAGAIAVIVRNQNPGAPIVQGGLDVPAITIPSVMVRKEAGDELNDYIIANPTATVEIDADQQRNTNALADMVADFSSRGPNTSINVLKPEVAAPGVDILAAVADGFGTAGIETGLISGTSMASPHNAGSAALLRALQPTWTPMQVKSALMLTAKTAGIVKEDETTPADWFDIGNGRIQVDIAAQSGLIMNETAANFEAANPDEEGDTRQLNLASLYSNNCIATANCSFERTFTNATAGSVTWDIAIDEPAGVTMTATPDNFTLAAGASQTVTFEADATDLDPADGFSFGSIVLSDAANTLDDLHLNVAIQASSGVVPETVTINTRRDAGSQAVLGMITPPSTDLTFIPSGLIKGTLVEGEIAEDSDNSDVFDDTTDGTFFQLLQPGEFGMRLVAEILSTESVDLDLRIGVDFNGDGQPQEDEVIASAATAAALERAEYRFLPAQFDYWILVQNWQGSGSAPDAFTMSYAYVPYEDPQNLSVQAPAAPPAGVPYDIRVFFDEPAMEAGERWYGALDVGGDQAGAELGAFGTIGVDLIRQEDDVTKSADVAVAVPGDTVTYTITVQPNVTPEALQYAITDAVPAGMQVVPGSAAASSGTVNVAGQSITWNLTMGLPGFDYVMTDSANDATCAMPLATDDGVADAYVNLSAFGITGQVLPSDGPFSFNLATVNGGVPFYQATTKSTTLFFNGNGVLSFDNPSIFSTPSLNGANVSIPNAALPNQLMALLWSDLSLITPGASSTVASANLNTGTGTPNIARIVEFDNFTVGNNPANTIDAEIYLDTRVLEGAPEIIFAYADPTGAFTSLTQGTIGLENADGSRGVEYAFNDAALQVPSGTAICFDLVQFSSPQTLTFDAVVQASAAGSVVVNNAQHDNDNPGSRAELASASVTVSPADLSITKTDNVAEVLAGGSLTYSIVATNNSGTTPVVATVNDTMPAGLTCEWTCAGSSGSTCAATGTGDIADTVTLLAGGTATYTATCDVAAGATGTISNTATVDYAVDTDNTDNSATDTTDVIAQNDLSITKTDGVTSVNAGDEVTYTIVASNNGATLAPATVSDVFGAPLAACEWTCSGADGGLCGAASGTGDIADIASLPGGSSVTYSATCSVPLGSTGTLSNTATVAGPNDPDTSDNTASDTDTVIQPQTDLAISVTDGVTDVVANESTTYTIVVVNTGTGAANDVLVTDNFPAPLTCSWTCEGINGGSCSAPSGTGNIAESVDLVAGSTVSFTATCALNNFPGATLTNTASLSYVNDSNAANDTDSDVNTVSLPADVIFRNGFED